MTKGTTSAKRSRRTHRRAPTIRQKRKRKEKVVIRKPAQVTMKAYPPVKREAKMTRRRFSPASFSSSARARPVAARVRRATAGARRQKGPRRGNGGGGNLVVYEIPFWQRIYTDYHDKLRLLQKYFFVVRQAHHERKN